MRAIRLYSVVVPWIFQGDEYPVLNKILNYICVCQTLEKFAQIFNFRKSVKSGTYLNSSRATSMLMPLLRVRNKTLEHLEI